MTAFFISISLLLYTAVALVLGWRIVELRRKRISPVVPGSLRVLVEHKVDTLAFHVVVVGKELLHYAHLSFLVVGQKTALVVKYIAHKLERRFGRVINSVKGKQELSRQGDASHFLREIKEHQDHIRSQSVL